MLDSLWSQESGGEVGLQSCHGTQNKANKEYYNLNLIDCCIFFVCCYPAGSTFCHLNFKYFKYLIPNPNAIWVLNSKKPLFLVVYTVLLTVLLGCTFCRDFGRNSEFRSSSNKEFTIHFRIMTTNIKLCICLRSVKEGCFGPNSGFRIDSEGSESSDWGHLKEWWHVTNMIRFSNPKS